MPDAKRRRLDGDSGDSSPRYSSPPDHERNDETRHDRRLNQPQPRRRSESADLRRNPRRSRSRSSSRNRTYHTRSQSPRSPSRSRSPRPSSPSRSRSPRPSSRLRSSTRRADYNSSRSRSSSSSLRSSPHSTYTSRSHSPRPSRFLQPREPTREPFTPLPELDHDHDHEPKDVEPLRPHFCRKLELSGHIGAVSQVRLSPDGRWIASASADGTAKLWNADTGAHLDTLVGHMAGLSCVAWGPDSKFLATGSDDKTIRVWDRMTGRPVDQTLSIATGATANGNGDGHENGARMHKHIAGIHVNGGSAYGEERISAGLLRGHHNYVHCLAFSPKGNILASGSYDESVILWDVRAGKLIRRLPAHSDPVKGVDFCMDGTLVVSCSTDGLIRIWDTATGQCLRTLVHEDNAAVTNVCFSPNGRFVLAFSLDNCIRLWECKFGVVKKTYQGHNNSGYSVGGCFGVLKGEKERCSEKNQKQQAFIASASEDGDILLWDVVTKGVLQRISGAHKGVCFGVHVNGDVMVSGGADNIIRLYRSEERKKMDVVIVEVKGRMNGIQESEDMHEQYGNGSLNRTLPVR